MKLQFWCEPGASPWNAFEDAADNVRVATNGQIDITMYTPGALLDDPDILPALGEGIVDIQWLSIGDFDYLDPGFAITCGMPGIWKDQEQVRVWFEQFGGRELLDAKLQEYNVKLLNIGSKGSEGIWSNVSLDSLDAFDGLIMRCGAGVAADILNTLGTKTVDLPGEETYSALQTNVVDAAEFGMMGECWGIGMQEVTKYVYWPSWHCPLYIGPIAVNMDTWNALSDDLKQALMYYALEAGINHNLYSQAEEIEVMPLVTDYGLVYQTATPEELARVLEISRDIIFNKYGAASDFAADLIESVTTFQDHFMG